MNETITRTPLDGGRYRYESNLRGTLIASSKVLYTYTSTFFVDDLVGGGSHPVLFHKSQVAALKAKGYPKYGWTKLGTAEIVEGSR